MTPEFREFVKKPRRSVTFILGRDNYAYNQYYTLANYYYRMSPDDRTDVVVDNLVSLSQVIDWLNSHPDTNQRPYGLVNIVSHGNEFIDLQATVTPHGSRISAPSLREGLADSTIRPPDSTVVDRRTMVFLHGCAVGQNQALLDAMSEAMGGATVVASRLFEYYAYLSPNRNPQSVRRYFARTWYAFYHPDSTITEEGFAAQLALRYPHSRVEWRDGLRRRFQDNPSQLYHYSFVVPCSYEEFYDNPAEMPSVSSEKKRRQWIANHPDFTALLDITGIPERYFQVKFYRKTALLDDESIAYGLRVKARAGVVCLIQPLVAEDTTGIPYAPYVPPIDDTVVFAKSK